MDTRTRAPTIGLFHTTRLGRPGLEKRTGEMTTNRINKTRCVWAAVTREPRATHRRLAELASTSTSTVFKALHALADLGYVELGQGKGTRRVLVEFR
jgi:hypothetical protein